jgi:hypothetical protein
MFGQSVQAGPGATGGTQGEEGVLLAGTLEVQSPSCPFSASLLKRLQLFSPQKVQALHSRLSPQASQHAAASLAVSVGIGPMRDLLS